MPSAIWSCWSERNADPRAEILACGISNWNVGARRIVLAGRTPSETEYCPASNLETICAASPRGAGTSSARVKLRMATFGSFISLRALVLLLPFGRPLAGWWSARGFTNPVLQGSARIQPSKNVRLDVVPQAVEGGAVCAVFPQLGDGRGRILAGHSAPDEIGPNGERLEVASALLAHAEFLELRRFCAGTQ